MAGSTNGFDKHVNGGGDGVVDWSEGNIEDLSTSSDTGDMLCSHSTSESVSGSVTARSLSDDFNRQSEALKTHDDFVRNESLAVKCSKIFVVLSIIAAAVACSLVVSHFVQASEVQDFETEFEAFAKEIADVSDYTATRAFTAIRSLSKSITVAAMSESDTSGNATDFPFFSIPYFHVQGGETKDISGAEVIAFAPLVKASQKKEWEEYAVANQGWIQDGLEYRGVYGVDPGPISKEIYSHTEDAPEHKPGQVQVEDYYLPVWQMAGAPVNASIVNLDLLTRSSFEHTMIDVLQNTKGILSDICTFSYLTEHSVDVTEIKEKEEQGEDKPHPQSYILEPVYDTIEDNGQVVGFVIAVFPWNGYFRNVLPDDIDVTLVVDDRCGDIHTYEINGPDVRYVGDGDLHHSSEAHLKYSVEFATFARHDAGEHPRHYHPDLDGTISFEEHFGSTYSEMFEDTSKGHCKYVLDVYPSPNLRNSYATNRGRLYAFSVVGIFGVILLLLMLFDFMVVRRQRKLMAASRKTHALVSSLFPENVQQRILQDLETSKKGTRVGNSALDAKDANGEMSKKMPDQFAYDTKPIADLFPSASIMFADLAGFTAWSSTREPTQVFALLEKIYQSFDALARTRRVFKVETVGDCYVAAAGLPEIIKDHAVVVARFARDCLDKFPKLVREMEVVLGPDTCELGLRVGIHSGPVTAGVLRGQKSRFQLFGDSVNTASRMESTGIKNKIQISQETANLLKEGGLGAWIRMRDTTVSAKGKGELQTYWLLSRSEQLAAGMGAVRRNSLTHSSGHNSSPEGSERFAMDDKESRLVGWNVKILQKLLKQIMATRTKDPREVSDLPTIHSTPGETVLDEVKEIISLPAKTLNSVKDANEIELPSAALAQLNMYVRSIASMYRQNPFHSFEHASHVTMSVIKLLSRIVAPDTIDYDDMCYKNKEASQLHDHTYGITSDPLTQFACALSALMHDVDHTGVPNAQLVKEKSDLALTYKNKSVAEQNSVDLAWDMLMEPAYKDLRQCIYSTQDELDRFRQLVVNSVMATDIVDKELGALRKLRWAKAFASNSKGEETDDDINRKATIVIEHLIQASDVSHTMQHWHVYLKWNERLFQEMYKAYLNGKSDKDPSEFWVQGELGFFDYYIIPLAMKLKECGVFGVSSDEYLNYAKANRSEWEQKGRAIVEKYVENYGKHRFSGS